MNRKERKAHSQALLNSVCRSITRLKTQRQLMNGKRVPTQTEIEALAKLDHENAEYRWKGHEQQ